MADYHGPARRSASVTAFAKRSSIWATTSRWSSSITKDRTTARIATSTFTTSVGPNSSSAKAGWTFVLWPNRVGFSFCIERVRRSPVAVGYRRNRRPDRAADHFLAAAFLAAFFAGAFLAADFFAGAFLAGLSPSEPR